MIIYFSTVIILVLCGRELGKE